MVSPPGMGTSHFGGSLHESGVSVIMERYLTGGVKRKVGRRVQVPSLEHFADLPVVMILQ